MQLLEKTLDTAAGNVALDEALLTTAEFSGQSSEWLRIWEPATPLVVVGRSSSVAGEVNVENCRLDGVPILRRCSGGAAIVAASGCLMYAVVLCLKRRPYLQAIDQAHRTILGQLVESIQPLLVDEDAGDAVSPSDADRADASWSGVRALKISGVSDLTLGNRKVSGNSLRCRRTHLLYHGTLLYDMALDLVARYLRMPPRQPDYRAERDHSQFLANLPVAREDLRDAVTRGWGDPIATGAGPQTLVESLIEDKYSRDAWNRKIP